MKTIKQYINESKAPTAPTAAADAKLIEKTLKCKVTGMQDLPTKRAKYSTRVMFATDVQVDATEVDHYDFYKTKVAKEYQAKVVKAFGFDKTQSPDDKIEIDFSGTGPTATLVVVVNRER